MLTKAAILSRVKKLLVIENLIVPELKAGQVLVKVAYSGICHSQLNEIQGLKGEDKYLPHTLGHEGSGVVQEVGHAVKKVKVGDHVVLTWIKGKGKSIPSAIYKRHNGTIVNSGAISTFMDYAVISENRLVKIPKEMPLCEAALLGCAVITGAGIIRNTAQVKEGSSLAVFGAGGLGMSAILAAKLARAALIIAVDIFARKLKLALKAGATFTINAQQTKDVGKRILEITKGRGLDYAIETAGRRQAMETAFAVVRDHGGLCILAGNLPQGECISLDPFDLIKGKRIVGTWGGESNPQRDIAYYAHLFLQGRLNLKLLITDVYHLDEINKAFRDLALGKVGRALIDMQE